MTPQQPNLPWTFAEIDPPANGEYYTATLRPDGSFLYCIGYFIDGTWLRVSDYFPVTHWMLLPTDPPTLTPEQITARHEVWKQRAYEFGVNYEARLPGMCELCSHIPQVGRYQTNRSNKKFS